MLVFKEKKLEVLLIYGLWESLYMKWFFGDYLFQRSLMVWSIEKMWKCISRIKIIRLVMPLGL